MIPVNRRVPIFGAAAALVLIVTWYLLLWAPQAKDLGKAHKAQAAAEQKAGELQTQLSSLRALTKQIPLDNAKFAQLQAALPDTPQLDQALNLVQQAASGSGVTVTAFNPSNPQVGGANGSQAASGPGGPAINLTLAVKGGFDQIKSFLVALDQLPRVFVVDKLSISNNGPSSTANISARIYYAGKPSP